MAVGLYWAAVLLMTLLLGKSRAIRDLDASYQELHLSLDPFSSSVGSLKTFWKRRRGGGGSDDDESSSPGSSDSDGSSSGNDCCTCWRKEIYTREAHNNDSYNSHYPIGNGAFDSTEGGYTPDGSGTAPIWDNSTGGWVSHWSYEVNAVGYNQNHLSYLGGASVPYLSGRTSPNGLDPIPFFDMHTIVGDSVVDDDDCAIPNSTYAYKYQVPYTWTEQSDDKENWGKNITTTAAVYCCCALNSLCGCDDFHGNRSFVSALVGIHLGSAGEDAPHNRSSFCVVDYQGKTTLLVDGTLQNGSTKADPNASYPIQTLTTMTSEYCSPTDGGFESGARKTQVSAPSSTAYVVAWTAVVSLGVLFGICFVLF